MRKRRRRRRRGLGTFLFSIVNRTQKTQLAISFFFPSRHLSRRRFVAGIYIYYRGYKKIITKKICFDTTHTSAHHHHFLLIYHHHQQRRCCCYCCCSLAEAVLGALFESIYGEYMIMEVRECCMLIPCVRVCGGGGGFV